MKLKPEMLPPRRPRLQENGLSPEELTPAAFVEQNLSAMEMFAGHFANAVALFLVCQEKNAPTGSLWDGWMWTAAHQGVLSLYNFRMALDGAETVNRLCPSWKGKVDFAALHQAKQRFRTEFPHTKELRQTVLHSAELHRSEEREKINIVRGEQYIPGGIYLDAESSVTFPGGYLSGSRYNANFGGKVVGYDVTWDSVHVLNDVARDFFSGFFAVQE